MSIRVYLILIICMASSYAFGQIFRLSEAEVHFYSEAPLENIEAVNTTASGLWNLESGDIVLSIPINRFVFERSLMQEHFNEKYMESEKYPRATFKGNLPVKVGDMIEAKGTINIHGVEKEYVITGSISKKSGTYMLDAVFNVKLVDHKINVPTLMWQNIAEVIQVRSKFVFTRR